jgi:hypothetical protein
LSPTKQPTSKNSILPTREAHPPVSRDPITNSSKGKGKRTKRSCLVLPIIFFCSSLLPSMHFLLHCMQGVLQNLPLVNLSLLPFFQLQQSPPLVLLLPDLSRGALLAHVNEPRVPNPPRFSRMWLPIPSPRKRELKQNSSSSNKSSNINASRRARGQRERERERERRWQKKVGHKIEAKVKLN